MNKILNCLQFFLANFSTVLFEYLENTENGMYFINKIKLWPGGKEKSDYMINRIGDQFYASIGWIIAYFVCNAN